MGRATGDGVEIALAHWPGDGPPVICLHGLTANCLSFAVIAEELGPGHDVWALDLRGRGASEKPAAGYGLRAHCSDVVAVMDDLNLERAVVMGHSLGAYVALSLAARHPDRVDKLVLLDGGAALDEGEQAKVYAWVDLSVSRVGMVLPSLEDYRDLLKMVPFLQPWTPALDQYLAYEIEECEGGVRQRASRAAVEHDAQRLRALDPAGLYPEVGCPVLALRSTEGVLSPDDLIMPPNAAQRMVAALDQARLAELTGTNHYNMIFAPTPLRRQYLLEFLND